jgi:hypothetical protein
MHLDSRACFALALAISVAALAQDSPKETSPLGDRLQLTTVYGPDHRACAYTISGPVSEDALMRAFAIVVPPAARGVKQQELRRDGIRAN